MTPLTNQQRLFQVESDQLLHAWLEAMATMAKYRYAMKWQRSGDKEYLLRRTHVRGMGKSLGVRSAQTEEIYAANQAARAVARANLEGLSARLQDQARLNRAARMGRLPNVVGELIGALVVAGLADTFRVVGTHAIYGYEALAGVHCKQELLASGDVDLLYDARKRLTLVAAKLDNQGLLGLLQRADKTFIRQALAPFRAVNASGFMVDMLTPERDMREARPVALAEGDLVATEVPNLHWLLNSPRVEAVALQENGVPVLMSVCDPRAFALHKAWLSDQPDRDPIKKPRDLAQATLVAELVSTYLPQFPFDAQALAMMPAKVREAAARRIEGQTDIRLPGLDF